MRDTTKQIFHCTTSLFVLYSYKYIFLQDPLCFVCIAIILQRCFVTYTIESITATIAKILECKPDEIQNVAPMEYGMTNRSYAFTYNGNRYLMRIPGEGTELLLSRENEYVVYQQVEKLGICEDIVYIDPTSGYKITTFWEKARVCDPHNFNDVAAAMKLLKAFHDAKGCTL